MAARKKQPERVQRRKEVFKEMQEIGAWNIDVKDLATKHGVSIQQICLDRRMLVKNLPKANIKEIRPVLRQFYENAMVKANNLVNDGNADRKEVCLAIKILIDACKEYTCFLESYGLKEKVAEKVDTKIELSWKQEE